MRTNSLRAALIAAALAAAAPAVHAVGGLTNVTIIDRDTGQRLPVYRHAGRSYVAGRPGARYAIGLRNQTGERVLAVLSVDGVNAVSGETAAWGQTGYVLGPQVPYQITGWRKTDREVAAFEFTALPESYAARTGRPANVGVIGVAVFRERQVPAISPPVTVPPSPPSVPKAFGESSSAAPGSAAPGAAASGSGGSRSTAPQSAASNSASSGASSGSDASESGTVGSARPAPDATAADAERRADPQAAARAQADAAAPLRRESRERLGTGHGGRETSVVTRTHFERARSTPDEVITLYYDSRDNLMAMGVIPRPWARPQPQPFPAPAERGYVPDPPA